MKKENILQLIKEALDAENEINDDSSEENIPEWDSLGHLSILTALDEATGGKASAISDLSEATSVKKIFDIFEKEGIIE